MTLPDVIGLIGVALLIVTYALLQLDRIDPKGFWYSFNNLLVAILVTVSLVYTPNLASIVIEVFWFLISLYGVVMFFKRKDLTNNKNSIT
tara:strand:- start:55368 stop:55637 length:270 start_codon:yes stop_codon:yes gene_type:complete